MRHPPVSKMGGMLGVRDWLDNSMENYQPHQLNVKQLDEWPYYVTLQFEEIE